MNFKICIKAGMLNLNLSKLEKGNLYGGKKEEVIWLYVNDKCISHFKTKEYKLRFEFYDDDVKYYTLVKK